MNIYLAKLKEKPFPNNIQKKGVSVTLFSDKKDEDEKLVQENKEVEENNEKKEEVPEEIQDQPTQEIKTKPKKKCIIKDGRNKTISRETIMETLKSNKIFSVTRKTLPKQMPDNVVQNFANFAMLLRKQLVLLSFLIHYDLIVHLK